MLTLDKILSNLSVVTLNLLTSFCDNNCGNASLFVNSNLLWSPPPLEPKNEPKPNKPPPPNNNGNKLPLPPPLGATTPLPPPLSIPPKTTPLVSLTISGKRAPTAMVAFCIPPLISPSKNCFPAKRAVIPPSLLLKPLKDAPSAVSLSFSSSNSLSS